jgi:hypothetical protein
VLVVLEQKRLEVQALQVARSQLAQQAVLESVLVPELE